MPKGGATASFKGYKTPTPHFDPKIFNETVRLQIYATLWFRKYIFSTEAVLGSIS